MKVLDLAQNVLCLQGYEMISHIPDHLCSSTYLGNPLRVLIEIISIYSYLAKYNLIT